MTTLPELIMVESSVPRDCIECDNEECHETNPPSMCGRCHTVYYCSKSCQEKHRSEHTAYCRDLGDMRRAMLGIDGGETQGEATNKNEPCVICLEQPMVNPIVLQECLHAFCFGCLRDYQAERRRMEMNTQLKIGCPLCRTQAPDIEESLLERARSLAGRANSRTASDEEKAALREEALEVLDKVLREDRNLQALWTKVEILAQMDRTAEAMAVLQTVEALQKEGEVNREKIAEILAQMEQAHAAGDYEETECRMKEVDEFQSTHFIQRFRDPVELTLAMAALKTDLEDWQGALDTYRPVFMQLDELEMEPRQIRAIFSGLCRCFYETGDYNRAISSGQAALEMNRHYPGVHKYLALACKEKGDEDEARRLLNQAVLYETPWDDAHRENVLKEYSSLLEES